MTRKRIHYLHHQYVSGQATEEELGELKSLLAESHHENEVLNWLDSEWEDLNHEELLDMPAARRKAIFERIVHKEKRKNTLRRMITWSAAAAIVISSALLYPYWVRQDKPVETVSLAQTDRDIEPGSDRATLTLADGRLVILGGQGEWEAILDSSLQISEATSDMLVYFLSQPRTLSAGEFPSYNTLRTPRGGQYQVMLPDGTKVMLNASSRLTYPEEFVAGERLVEFEGEGYFEVAPDRSRPFVVKTRAQGIEQEVRVLGTEFNINSYDHACAVLTTVVGGRVAVSGEEVGQVILHSGGQSVFQSTQNASSTLRLQRADLGETMAWRDGLFVFNNEALPDLLKRVSRWYDVEFVYNEELGDVVFQGNYFRNKGLLNLLRNLEATGRVQFQIDQTDTNERRIYVIKT